MRLSLLLALAGAWAGQDFLVEADRPLTTYRENLAPVFAAKCVSCHTKNGAGPFSLRTYEEVSKKAELINTVAILQKMPPTSAASDFGPIARHAALTDAEVIAIQEWVRTGMPEGSGPVPKVEEPPKWPLGAPSLVLRNTERLIVPAEGAEAFRTTVVDPGLVVSRDLIAFDLRPATPFAARQAVLATESRGENTAFLPTGIDASRLIGPWGIGYHPLTLPPDAGIRIHPRQRIRVRMLYHPTGKSEDGGFELALYFSDEPRPLRAAWKTVGSNSFEITGEPPAYTELSAFLELDRPMQALSVLPEARWRAIGVRLNAGAKAVLNIPRWNKRWVGAYNLKRPAMLPARTTLQALIQYDNSNHDPSLSLSENKDLPNNPTAHFGPKETDELFWVHVLLVPQS